MLTMGFIGFGKSANRYHLPYVILRENIKVKTILIYTLMKNLQHHIWKRACISQLI